MIRSIAQANHHDIQVKRFGDVRVSSPFFDSFRKYYGPYYLEWLKKKVMDPIYIVEEGGHPIAFMKLKQENEDEDYSDITPKLIPDRRLKISSFKVAWGFYGLSLRMMDLAVTEAIFSNVSELYGTIPVDADYRQSLVNFLNRYGFRKHGIKVSHGIVEEVYIKQLKS